MNLLNSFRSSYPSWEPNAEGKLYLSALGKFQEQQFQFQVQRTNPANRSTIPPRMTIQQGNLDCRGPPEMPFNRMNENHPYILDWFYTLQAQSSSDDDNDNDNDASREVSSQLLDVIIEHKEEYFRISSYPLRQTEKEYDEEWGHLYESRRNCDIEASTSAPLFHESVLHHSSSHEEEEQQQQPGGSRWWARNRSVTVNPNTETSFLEPPNFVVHQRDDDDDDNNISEEDGLEWRNSSRRLSKSFIMDDLKGGDFDLPFDIYRKPPGDDEDLGPLDNI